jgi:hypothetical protein
LSRAGSSGFPTTLISTTRVSCCMAPNLLPMWRPSV